MPKKVKHAVALRVGRCANPECEHLHLDYLNKRGEVFASATLPDDFLQMVVAAKAQPAPKRLH